MRAKPIRKRKPLTADQCVHRMIKRDVMAEGLSSHEMAMALVKASTSMGWPLFDREAAEVSAAMRAGADEIDWMRRNIAARWRHNPQTDMTEYQSAF